MEIRHVSNAALGQLRPPSSADIQQRIAAADQNPAQKQANVQSMARLEKAAMQFVAMKQHGRQMPAPQPQKTSVRSEPVKAPLRHNSVAPAGYGDKAARGYAGRARTPDHVTIQRSTQAHIQRNLQRDTRNERFRQVGRYIKEQGAALVHQLGRAVRGRTQSMPPPSPGKVQTVQSERAYTHKMQSMTKHREKTQHRETGKEKGRSKEPLLQQTPARQHQPQQRKEQDRGRSR